MIICKICSAEFESMITWRHLAKHGITVAEYKIQHGEVSTDAYRSAMSQRASGSNNPSFGKKREWSDEQRARIKGRTAHNKGTSVTDPKTLARRQAAMALREQRFVAGEFSRGAKKTEQQKKILSDLTQAYAVNHQLEVQKRATVAVATKIARGYDFGQPRRGKKHSDSARQKISNASTKTAEIKSQQAYAKLLTVIADSGLTFIGLHGHSLDLSCNQCTSTFSFTRQYFTPSKYRLEICPTCFPRTTLRSKGESELFNFVVQFAPDAVQGYRSSYHSKELDVFVPSLNLGFEYNGLYWHSEEVRSANGKNPKYDSIKQQEFQVQGIRVVNVFEDEWINHDLIVKSRIKSMLGAVDNKIYARQCAVRVVSSSEASAFCQQTHLMGKARSNVRLGLYFMDRLVSLMTFSSSNISRKVQSWEINRFSSVLDTLVVGGASKLLAHFVKQYRPESIISYSDNRWSLGAVYKTMGFTKISSGTPGYWYVPPNTVGRIHRFTLRKNASDDPELTEYENRVKQGYTRIWDCGSSKWLWSPVV